jgi:Skp family chaperone for outer membrane proteins
MRYAVYLWGIVICAVLVVVLLLRVMSLDSRVRSHGEPNGDGLAALQDSLKQVQADLATAKESMPGLGDYMTTIQLHVGKVWFAAKASNWELAQYELDELKETMEAAKALNVEKNGVKISDVLDSVLQTQVAQVAESIEDKSAVEFQKSYDETLSACNGCHTEAGYKFIHIVRPSAPPVTNQSWELDHCVFLSTEKGGA